MPSIVTGTVPVPLPAVRSTHSVRFNPTGKFVAYCTSEGSTYLFASSLRAEDGKSQVLGILSGHSNAVVDVRRSTLTDKRIISIFSVCFRPYRFRECLCNIRRGQKDISTYRKFTIFRPMAPCALVSTENGPRSIDIHSFFSFAAQLHIRRW